MSRILADNIVQRARLLAGLQPADFDGLDIVELDYQIESVTTALARRDKVPNDGLVLDAEFFVNVYERGREYGGPEEGDWWYDTGRFCADLSRTARTELEAEIARDRLERYFDERKPRFDLGSIMYNGGVYAVRIEDKPGEDFPAVRPHYE